MSSKQKAVEATADKSKRSTKPFLEIKTFESVNKRFTISKHSETILKSYTDYLKQIGNNKNLTENSVIDALIQKLNTDRDFTKWHQGQSHVLVSSL